MVKGRSLQLELLNPYITSVDFTKKEANAIREVFLKCYPGARFTSERVIEKLTHFYTLSMLGENKRSYLALNDADAEFLQTVHKIITDHVSPILKSGKEEPSLEVTTDIAGNTRLRATGFIAGNTVAHLYALSLTLASLGKSYDMSERAVEKCMGFRINDAGIPESVTPTTHRDNHDDGFPESSAQIMYLGGRKALEFECVLRQCEQADGTVLLTQEAIDEEMIPIGINQILSELNLLIPHYRNGSNTLELNADGTLTLNQQDKQTVIDHIHRLKTLYRLAPAAVLGDFTVSQCENFRDHDHTNAHPDLEKFVKSVQALASYEVDSNKTRFIVPLHGTMDELIDGLKLLNPELESSLHRDGDFVKIDKRMLGRLMASSIEVVRLYVKGEYNEAYDALSAEKDKFTSTGRVKPPAVHRIIEDHAQKEIDDFMRPLATAEAVLGLSSLLEERLKNGGINRSQDHTRFYPCKDTKEQEALQSLCKKLAGAHANQVKIPFAAHSHGVIHAISIGDEAYGSIKSKLGELQEAIEITRNTFHSDRQEAEQWRDDACKTVESLNLTQAEQALLPARTGHKIG